MKRIVTIGIVLFAAIAILGLVSCGGGGGTPQFPIFPAQPNATLTGVKFGNEVATLGTPGGALGAAVEGSVILLQSSVTVVATPADPLAEVYYLKQSEGEEADEGDFWGDATFDFTTGDKLHIRVTASDQVTKLYYTIGVTLIDVALDTVTVGGVTATKGNPGASWQTATAGSVLFSTMVGDQPAGGLAVSATPATTGSTVKYGHAVGDAEPSFDDTTTIHFEDGEFLYIQVTGESGVAYYKIQVYFRQSATIKYGKVQVKASSEKFIDPLWDTVDETYSITRVYAADSGSYLAPGSNYPKTTPIAKAMWDEEGLYIYLKVTDSDVSLVDNEHESDSLELFVNEDLTYSGNGTQKYSNGGSQYRVAANGQLSGHPADVKQVLTDHGKTSAWKTDDGYIIVMQAPWRLRNKFFSNTTYRNDWKFGFELQVNIAGETGNRYGVLVWNNVDHSNYTNAADYGEAKLTGQSGTLVYPALPPAIASAGQPQGGAYSTGASVSLSVTATTLDAGALTYQWYSADASTDGNSTKIESATSATYSFVAPADTTWYYVVVTNTLGTSTATTTSNRARVAITDLPQVQRVSIVNGAYAIYKIELPDGQTWADYSGITADYYVEATPSGAIRGTRLMGNYDESDITTGDGNLSIGSFNAPWIMDNTNVTSWDTLGAKPNTWFTISYDTTGDKGHDDFKKDGMPHMPASTATGPFYFGIGLSGQAKDHATAPGPIVQIIKNVTLWHKTDVTKNAVANTGIGFVGYGDAENKFEMVDSPPAPMVQQVSIVNGAYAIYKFELPSGQTWGDYTGITANYYVETTPSGAIRGTRLMGNYDESDITTGDGNLSIGSFNAPWIMDNTNVTSWDTLGAKPKTWFKISYDITGTKGHDDFKKDGMPHMPASTATGPFYFGIGLSGQAKDHATAPGPINQIIKNVTLKNKSTTNRNLDVVTNTVVGFVGYGDAENTFEAIPDPTF